jgi:hypothetical protein
MKEFSRKRPANTVISGKSAERQEDRKMAENIAKSDDFTRGVEALRPITVRFAPEIASRLEADAHERDASPTEIVRAIVCAHYGGDGETAGVRALSAELRALGERLDERFWQLMYEHSRNRNSLFDIALAPVRDEQALRAILKDSKESARRWVEQCRKSELRNNGSQPESDGLKE